LAKGLMAPHGALPGAYVSERTSARAVACLGGPGHAADAVAHGASLVAASTDADFAEQIADLLNAAGLEVQTTTDVTGVELAGAGDLVATVVAEGSRNRRAGDMLGRGMTPDQIVPALGQAAEGLDAVPLLAEALRAEGVRAPALNGLAAVLAGRMQAEQWTGA